MGPVMAMRLDRLSLFVLALGAAAFISCRSARTGDPRLSTATVATAVAVIPAPRKARFITGVVLPVDGGWCVSEGQ